MINIILSDVCNVCTIILFGITMYGFAKNKKN